MSIRLYDEALSKKISSWLPKRNGKDIRVLKPDESNRLFSLEAAEAAKEHLTLPMISISRDTSFDLLQRTMTPMSLNGLLLDANGQRKLNLNAIPIGLSYQIDIYTKSYDESCELLREFIFKLVNNTQLVIELPYNGEKLKSVATISVESSIEDTSNIAEKLFPDQFTRWSIRLTLSGAYLFSLPITDVPKVEGVVLEVASNREEPYDFTEE